jgi:hypothetical protein
MIANWYSCSWFPLMVFGQTFLRALYLRVLPFDYLKQMRAIDDASMFSTPSVRGSSYIVPSGTPLSVSKVWLAQVLFCSQHVPLQ